MKNTIEYIKHQFEYFDNEYHKMFVSVENKKK